MVGKFKVITLCGSTRFKDQFLEVQKRLTLEGNIVISVCLFGHSGDEEVWTEGTKEMLDDMHKRKIDMADAIYVINVGGYIGESTRAEIEYAREKGKEIMFLEPDTDSLTEIPEESAKASPKHNTKRSGIGWLIVFMLYPLLFYIAPFVALFFLLYYIGVGWLCLALAILGILFYAYFVFWFLREWKRSKDPNYKPPTSGTYADFGHGPQWNAGIVGLALYHGLSRGNHNNT